MKNIKKFTLGAIGATLLVTGLWACSNDDVAETDSAIEQSAKTIQSFGTQVSSLYIDNGIASASSNNILVFDSREALEDVFNQIVQEYDIYNETLDAQIPADLTDDELDDYIDDHNIDEDYTLNNFENNFGFKSLRKIINERELTWLETQGEILDINTDPDNHFIVSDFERTLLNEGSELIIKDEEGNPVIFKYYEWGHIEITNLNTEILKEININNINTPEALEPIAASNSSFLSLFKKNKPGEINPGCRKSGKRVEYYYFDGKQIKGFTSQNQGIFDKTLVAKTKGYQWKSGKWRNKKIWIHAGISGLNRGDWIIHNSCAVEMPGTAVWKDKKRNKLEYRLHPNNPNLVNITVKNNKVYSYHSEGGTSFFVDFYDYQATKW